MAPLHLFSSVLHTMRRLQQSLLCVQTFLARTRLALLYSCTWRCPGVSRGSSPTSPTEVFWVLWSYLPWTANHPDRWVHLCKTSAVWQLEIHLLCCRAILWESHCSGLSVPSLLPFLIGTVRTFLVRWVNTTWGWSHLSPSLRQVALLSLGGMFDSECQRHTSTFLACRSLAGHTSVVAAESIGVSLALDVVVCWRLTAGVCGLFLPLQFEHTQTDGTFHTQTRLPVSLFQFVRSFVAFWSVHVRHMLFVGLPAWWHNQDL